MRLISGVPSMHVEHRWSVIRNSQEPMRFSSGWRPQNTGKDYYKLGSALCPVPGTVPSRQSLSRTPVRLLPENELGETCIPPGSGPTLHLERDSGHPGRRPSSNSLWWRSAPAKGQDYSAGPGGLAGRLTAPSSSGSSAYAVVDAAP